VLVEHSDRHIELFTVLEMPGDRDFLLHPGRLCEDGGGAHYQAEPDGRKQETISVTHTQRANSLVITVSNWRG
jgi:hypothetical protein